MRGKRTLILLIRLALMIGALVLLWWGRNRFGAWDDHRRTFFEISVGQWLAWVGILVGAGVLVGLGGIGSLRRGYRWSTPLVVSLPPALLLAHFILLWGYAVPNEIDLPGFLNRPTFFMEFTSLFALAIMVGVGISLGFVPPKTPSTPQPDASER